MVSLQRLGAAAGRHGSRIGGWLIEEALDHIRWLGGSPCAGKSSVSRLLAERHRVRVYHVDDEFRRHAQHATSDRQPITYKWTHTPWDALWMQEPDVLLAEAIAAYSEQFPMILEDLRALPSDRLVLAEGTSLLPDLVAPLLSDPEYGMWLVPTEVFQRTAYPGRGAWVQQILSTCADPALALGNWMDRDVAFAEWILGRTAMLGLCHLQVDGRLSVPEVSGLVCDRLGLTAQQTQLVVNSDGPCIEAP